ncbi:Hypothetical predicted protein [Pelobates cultripes]|uniref:Reverse transcriptase domain-containing protein n=1 Tax=Pelobates cultripes TaxID=61616 RepID=A0AAD1VMV3_PELCU|nr:Hypothetical predicted protein [Pelobates cultripes]
MLVKPDQLDQEARDNTKRILVLIHQTQRTGEDLLLLSTDVQKVFDRVSWDFLFCTLQSLAIFPAMRCNPDIKGLKVGHTSHKLGAYADDLIFFVSLPETTLPNIMQEFDRYGKISHFKINCSKLNILNISVSPMLSISLGR